MNASSSSQSPKSTRRGALPAGQHLRHTDAPSCGAARARLRQKGIGLVGFIVGIVVGLAVALAVAVYITKVPTPFTDKSKAKTAEEQAAEEARLKTWNPNAPLASKTPSPSASGHIQAAPGTPPATVTPPPVATAPAQPLPPTTGADSSQGVLGDREQELARAKAEAEAKLKADLRAQELARAKAKAEEDRRREEINASSDPIGALLQERTRQQAAAAGPNNANAPAAQAAPAGDAFVYYVQVGAFRDPNGADSQKARLSMLGLSARINERQQSGRTVYQVRLGPFQNKRDADAARSRVEGSGMETALVRVQR